MHVIFVSSPGLGHINPMIPLARALAARGHEVRWAVAAEFTGHLERLGFIAHPAGLGERERWRQVRAAIGADQAVPGPPPGFGGPNGFATLFGRVSARPMAESLSEITSAWPPDLVVHDMSELASAPVAGALGIAHVTHSWAWVLPPETYGPAAEWTADLWTERGLRPRADGGVFEHLFLHPFPGELAAGPRPPLGNLQAIRPAAVTPLATDTTPAWLDGLGEGAIYLTLGTIFNDAGPLRGMIAALAGLGREVVVTTGPRIDAADLGDMPDNCHVAAYIPQDAILPHCALVVSHAGAGTFLGAAAHGIPQVCLPMGADQFLNAQVAMATGVGVALPPEQRTGEDVVNAARQVLAGAAYRQRAREVAGQLARMPTAEEVAPAVEALAGAREGVR